MDAPRTRYRVVERGRRLEVIDTWNHDAPVRRVADPMPAARHGLEAAAKSLRTPPVQAARAPRFDQRGRGLIHTQRWYDDKGPRQIVVTPQGEEKLKGLRIVALVAVLILLVMGYLFWPLLFIVPFLALNEGTRKNLRAASTKFLDEINQPLTDSSAG
ncbi:MAG: hypothetical protein EON88_33755 [Brevundimonas sp.]|nr:MAG: hypothetical protein EON88_33755 [Brevundimonas sp.]